MGLINERLNRELDLLVGKCFAINRMLDRGMSLLDVRWVMIKTSQIMHPKVAHAFPGDEFADFISDYQAKRNMETVYPATPIGDKDYIGPLDFFKDFFNECQELEDMIKNAVDIALDEDDLTTKTELLDQLLKNLVPYTALAINLVDLGTNYDINNNLLGRQMLDGFIDMYINI